MLPGFRLAEEGFKRISSLAKEGTPFLFIIPYDKSTVFAEPLSALPGNFAYTISSHPLPSILPDNEISANLLHKNPIPFKEYNTIFKELIEEIRRGNSYLLNLTFATPVETSLSMSQIFSLAEAPFKLLIDGHFVCYSPERFIEIDGNTIRTFPMKGTIDASIPNAEKKILSDKKEMAEHVMITDLMRNDLNQVASRTFVKKFRYIDKIVAGDKELLQVSSKIEAELPDNWPEYFGEILDKITPAGSITGTPKKKTVEIINRLETKPRGLYTGVFGICNGKKVQSAVMIRSLQMHNNQLYYHSGGGITIDSSAKSEYKEMIDKIYLPFNPNCLT